MFLHAVHYEEFFYHEGEEAADAAFLLLCVHLIIVYKNCA